MSVAGIANPYPVVMRVDENSSAAPETVARELSLCETLEGLDQSARSPTFVALPGLFGPVEACEKERKGTLNTIDSTANARREHAKKSGTGIT